MLFSYTIEEADRCASMLSSSRTRSGLSRKAMSIALDVSESTVKSWENGHGSPTLNGILDWFYTVGESPFRPMLNFFWPNMFANINEKSTDDEIREAGMFYFAKAAGPGEIQKLQYLIWGDHGADWSGLLDMAYAHTHTSLSSRYRTAEIIQMSYALSTANGLARTPAEIIVDRKLLLLAIASAKEASGPEHKRGYAICRNRTGSSALLANARTDSGVTQLEMAKALGKTLHTIQKWETDYDPPFLDLCNWFRVLDMPLWPYMLCKNYPTEKISFREGDERRRRQMVAYIATADSTQLRKLVYLIAGMHGSNWMALLEMMLEYVCLPAAQQVIAVRSVLINYELEHGNPQTWKPDDTLPDFENLNRYFDSLLQAARQ